MLLGPVSACNRDRHKASRSSRWSTCSTWLWSPGWSRTSKD